MWCGISASEDFKWVSLGEGDLAIKRDLARWGLSLLHWTSNHNPSVPGVAEGITTKIVITKRAQLLVVDGMAGQLGVIRQGRIRIDAAPHH
jgi:hypothetical protein